MENHLGGRLALVSGGNVFNGGLWNIGRLATKPHFAIGPAVSGQSEVQLTGPGYRGHKTTVYGILGRPDSAAGPTPAVVLAHGGRGRADSTWVKRWTDLGYFALALDLDGAGRGGDRLADGMPRMDDIFQPGDPTDSWTYHAVSAALKGVSVLASMPQVDASAISMVGISMGGIVTCIAASLDIRLNSAVSIYGCGSFADTPEWIPSWPADFHLAEWNADFNPDVFLSECTTPLLFITGPDDAYFPIDRVERSASLCATSSLRVKPGLLHSHNDAIQLSDVYDFVLLATESGRQAGPAISPR